MQLHIFICYRRVDTKASAGRLYDSLNRIPQYSLFKDLERMPLGKKFREVITHEIDKCDIFVVVIGKQFASHIQEKGKSALPNVDSATFEINYALRKKKMIIPVFVDGAQMPNSRDLPKEIAQLSSIHGINILHERWGDDVRRLIIEMEGRYLEDTKSMQTKIRQNDFNQINDSIAFYTDPRDEEKYIVLKINNLWWMAENFRYNHFDSAYYMDDPSNFSINGRLYTWEGALSVCPEGWRLPMAQDWCSIREGQFEVKDLKVQIEQLLKKKEHILPVTLGGYRSSKGEYKRLNSRGDYWGMTEKGSDYPWYISFGNSQQPAEQYDFSSNYARTCRFVKAI